MSEQTVNFRVEYDVRGVDQSIRQTQRVLLFMNSIRLAAVDIQQVMSGPNLSNILWTSIQLTRVWTNLQRVVNQTNQAQRLGMARGATLGGTRAPALGQMTLAGQAIRQPLMAQIAAALGVTPFALGALAGTILVVGGFIYLDRKRILERTEWRKRQREIAKSQGLEN